MRSTENKSMEERIVRVARQLFIERGFAETSMSDIAAHVGINRPVLHYYFRTKDRMFEAVFSDIVHSFIPAVQDIILQDKPLPERIGQLVDVYLEVMRREPGLPLFMVREINRDVAHLVLTVQKLETACYINKVKEVLLEEMAQGKIRQVPIEFVFYTFYGLLFSPFLARPLADVAFNGENAAFDEKLTRWKAHIVGQMEALFRL